MTRRSAGRVVIVGGGIGGLLAAHALAPFARTVTVLERNPYPDRSPTAPPPARRGVPQSHCLHMLMGAGAQVFDCRVPGWRSSLESLGARSFDVLGEARMRMADGWLPRQQSGLRMYACSRTLLEDMLRFELARNANVTLTVGARVTGLVASDDGATVSGAVIEKDERQRVELADLVVETGGGASQVLRWLQSVGACNDMPEDTALPSPWTYVSRWVRIDESSAPEWNSISIAPAPLHPTRSGMALRAENGFWNVVLLAGPGERNPVTDQDFQEFADNLADGELGALLARSTPVSPVHVYGRTTNRFRHWDRAKDWPSGLIVLGDAAMTLDPYFGLGMTNAARGVDLVAKMIEESGVYALNTGAFQRGLAELNTQAWGLVTARDRNGMAQIQDNNRLLTQYRSALTRLDVARAVLECHHLMRPIESLREDAAG